MVVFGVVMRRTLLGSRGSAEGYGSNAKDAFPESIPIQRTCLQFQRSLWPVSAQADWQCTCVPSGSP